MLTLSNTVVPINRLTFVSVLIFFSGFSNSFISSCGNSFLFKIVLTMLIWFIYSSCEHVCDFTVRKYPKPAVFFIFHTDIGVNGNYIEFRFILSKNSSCWICTLGYEIRYYKANSLERRYRIHHWIPMFFGKILLPIPFFRHPSCVRKGLESRLSRLQLWPISPNPGWACFSLSLGPRPADDGAQFYEVSYFINICVVTFPCFPF